MNEERKKVKLQNFLLWTIRNQERLGNYTRGYLIGFTALFSFLGLTGVISIESALEIILISGLTLWLGLALLIFKRRSWLLKIEDPELKREAYAAMLHCIAVREGVVSDKHSPAAQQER